MPKFEMKSTTKNHQKINNLFPPSKSLHISGFDSSNKPETLKRLLTGLFKQKKIKFCNIRVMPSCVFLNMFSAHEAVELKTQIMEHGLFSNHSGLKKYQASSFNVHFAKEDTDLNPKKKTMEKNKLSSKQENTVFVGGIFKTSNSEFKTCFENKFGSCFIKETRVVTNQGYGYVTFSNEKIYNESLKLSKKLKIKGYIVEVKPYNPLMDTNLLLSQNMNNNNDTENNEKNTNNINDENNNNEKKMNNDNDDGWIPISDRKKKSKISNQRTMPNKSNHSNQDKQTSSSRTSSLDLDVNSIVIEGEEEEEEEEEAPIEYSGEWPSERSLMADCATAASEVPPTSTPLSPIEDHADESEPVTQGEVVVVEEELEGIKKEESPKKKKRKKRKNKKQSKQVDALTISPIIPTEQVEEEEEEGISEVIVADMEEVSEEVSTTEEEVGVVVEEEEEEEVCEEISEVNIAAVSEEAEEKNDAPMSHREEGKRTVQRRMFTSQQARKFDDTPISCFAFVGGFPDHISEEDLKESFSQYGEVDFSFVKRDDNGQSKKWGVVVFGNEEACAQAILSSPVYFDDEYTEVKEFESDKKSYMKQPYLSSQHPYRHRHDHNTFNSQGNNDPLVLNSRFDSLKSEYSPKMIMKKGGEFFSKNRNNASSSDDNDESESGGCCTLNSQMMDSTDDETDDDDVSSDSEITEDYKKEEDDDEDYTEEDDEEEVEYKEENGGGNKDIDENEDDDGDIDENDEEELKRILLEPPLSTPSPSSMTSPESMMVVFSFEDEKGVEILSSFVPLDPQTHLPLCQHYNTLFHAIETEVKMLNELSEYSTLKLSFDGSFRDMDEIKAYVDYAKQKTSSKQVKGEMKVSIF